jgi:hypothetical protein
MFTRYLSSCVYFIGFFIGSFEWARCPVCRPWQNAVDTSPVKPGLTHPVPSSLARDTLSVTSRARIHSSLSIYLSIHPSIHQTPKQHACCIPDLNVH